jgi:hypothetical protein
MRGLLPLLVFIAAATCAATCTVSVAEAKGKHTPLASANTTATAADIKLRGMAGAKSLKRSSNHVVQVDHHGHTHTLPREISSRARRTYTGTYSAYDVFSGGFKSASCLSCPDDQMAYVPQVEGQRPTACGSLFGAWCFLNGVIFTNLWAVCGIRLWLG